MSVSQEEISAFIDDELPAGRRAEVAAALAADPVLAARAAAYRRDQASFAAALAPVAAAPLPAAWLARIEAAVQAGAPRAAPAWRGRLRHRRMAPVWAIAACVTLLLGGGVLWGLWPAGADTILREADAARRGTRGAVAMYDGDALPAAAARDAMLRQATGLAVRAPDLSRLGWQLAGLETYRGAAELRYRNVHGAALTLYVRRSAGTPRFDLLRRGTLRVCVWQDDVVGAVIMGDMAAGEMMRVAGLAYADLNL
jgi:anti-sigma factor RsiW